MNLDTVAIMCGISVHTIAETKATRQLFEKAYTCFLIYHLKGNTTNACVTMECPTDYCPVDITWKDILF